MEWGDVVAYLSLYLWNKPLHIPVAILVESPSWEFQLNPFHAGRLLPWMFLGPDCAKMPGMLKSVKRKNPTRIGAKNPKYYLFLLLNVCSPYSRDILKNMSWPKVNCSILQQSQLVALAVHPLMLSVLASHPKNGSSNSSTSLIVGCEQHQAFDQYPTVFPDVSWYPVGVYKEKLVVDGLITHQTTSFFCSTAPTRSVRQLLMFGMSHTAMGPPSATGGLQTANVNVALL